MVIEIADSQERIDAFLPLLQEIVTEGMITVEKVQILAFRPGDRAP